jgi:hypothetical protein
MILANDEMMMMMMMIIIIIMTSLLVECLGEERELLLPVLDRGLHPADEARPHHRLQAHLVVLQQREHLRQ